MPRRTTPTPDAAFVLIDVLLQGRHAQLNRKVPSAATASTPPPTTQRTMAFG